MVLHPPRPNPFNPNTTLQFELPRSGVVWLRIYDVTGRLVRTLVRGEEYPAGIGSVPWNGQDDVHRPAASGGYLVRLDNAGITETQRAILVR
jgi:flagellar hook assembly protein FlgD